MLSSITPALRLSESASRCRSPRRSRGLWPRTQRQRLRRRRPGFGPGDARAAFDSGTQRRGACSRTTGGRAAAPALLRQAGRPRWHCSARRSTRSGATTETAPRRLCPLAALARRPRRQVRAWLARPTRPGRPAARCATGCHRPGGPAGRGVHSRALQYSLALA